MIQTEDLSKQFGDFKAVDGVTLDVQPGQVLALQARLGPALADVADAKGPAGDRAQAESGAQDLAPAFAEAAVYLD